MEKCARCRIRADQVKLFDVIYEGRLTLLCERCSIIENIPLISTPSSNQLKESERGIGVYERMRKLAGLDTFSKKPETIFRSEKLKELDNHPELERPEKKSIDLIDHFHWEIMKTRRRKGYSQEQLANILQEPVYYIESLERGVIPDNSETIIKKLEQFLQIKIRKVSSIDLLEKIPKKPVLLDEYGGELDKIPEPKIPEIKKEEDEEIVTKMEELDLKRVDPRALTIKELREMHKRKIEATKQEKKEEQKRIEVRERLIEARKEELRLIKEKESKELDNLLGGAELLDNNDSEIELDKEEIDKE